MQRRGIGADNELAARMFVVMFLLAGLYLGFMAVLFSVGLDFVSIGIIAAVLLGVQYFFSDKLVLMSMGAKEISAQEAPDLHATVERLAAMADLPKPKIAMMDTDIPNAFATGRDSKNSVVAVTTGLLRRLEEPELEAVLAHELTHIKNRDVMVITLATFFATVAQFIMNSMFWSSMFGGYSSERRRDGGAAMLVYLASLVVWIVSFFLIRALSRYREFAADRGGAIVTGAPSQLASALLKISGVMERIPQEDLRQVGAANAFFIIPALSGDSLAGLLSTHPPVEQRIERLKRMEREMEGLS